MVQIMHIGRILDATCYLTRCLDPEGFRIRATGALNPKTLLDPKS